MSISFQCTRCGKQFNVADDLAGKAAKCKQCGQRLTIPAREATLHVADLYDVEEDAPLPRAGQATEEALPPRAAVRSVKEPRRPGMGTPVQASTNSFEQVKTLGRGVVAFIFILGICLKGYNAFQRSQRRDQAMNQAQAFVAPPGHGQPTAVAPSVSSNPDAPIPLPAFPELGPGTELEPGIMFHNVRLPGGPTPGFSGKIWVYLPSGEHAPRSLPCVMITGAGSNLLTGMELGDGDRPEHLPYIRAGFAVLAYELDGMLQNRTQINNAELGMCMNKFLAARAGLVNAHIAIEFLLAKVSQVDPQRIYTAGHSSAGTMSLLFAEHEPRLKACVAFAAAIDLAKRFGPQDVQQLQRLGFGDFATTYSPKDGEGRLNCPVFLFHARDDSNIPVFESESCAQRLQQMGKAVTLETVTTGNHYDSMVQQGIPRAIAWLQEKAGMPVTVSAPEDSITPQPEESYPPANSNMRPNPLPVRPPFPGRIRGPRFGPRSPRFRR